MTHYAISVFGYLSLCSFHIKRYHVCIFPIILLLKMLSIWISFLFQFINSMEYRRFPTSLKSVFEDDDVIAYKPRDDLWLLQTKQGIPVTFYVLEGTEKALVIDTGHVIKNFKDLIKKVTQKPFILALSHGHHDHVGSIDEFDTIYMDKADQYLIPNYK